MKKITLIIMLTTIVVGCKCGDHNDEGDAPLLGDEYSTPNYVPYGVPLPKQDDD